MKKCHLILFIIFIFTVKCYAEPDHTAKYNVEGSFICLIDRLLIYLKNEAEDEDSPSSLLKSINLNKGNEILIDKEVINCVRKSSTEIIYAKEQNIFVWDSTLDKRELYYKVPSNSTVIGMSFDMNSSTLLIIQINNNDVGNISCKIVDHNKKTIFNTRIKINEMESEAMYPVINVVPNNFIFQIQMDLFKINIQKIDLNLISKICDCYALTDSEIIYYELDHNDKTKGYLFDLNTSSKLNLDASLDGKVGFFKSFLYTANINNKNIPVCILDNKSFFLNDNKWDIGNSAFIYKNNSIIIKHPVIDNKINRNYFSIKSDL